MICAAARLVVVGSTFTTTAAAPATIKAIGRSAEDSIMGTCSNLGTEMLTRVVGMLKLYWRMLLKVAETVRKPPLDRLL
jgi:hypothetical protein